MMFNGILLALGAGLLIACAIAARRPFAAWGFACLALAWSVSAYRRIVFRPPDLMSQVSLDRFVIWAALVGAALHGADAVIRHLEDNPDSGGRMGHILRRALGAMALPAALLFISAGVFAWDGQSGSALSMEQSLRSIERGQNVSAATARALDLAEDAVKAAQRVARSGDTESAGIASYRLEILRETLR